MIGGQLEAPDPFNPDRKISVDGIGIITVQDGPSIAPGPENVYSVRGTEFERSSAPGAITPQLAAHVVGSLGPVTAQQLKTLGTPYDAASIVGQSGLQASQERTLAGVPSAHIDIENASGAPVKLLARFGGRPGAAVRTSIDPRVQRAAEEALAQSTPSNVDGGDPSINRPGAGSRHRPVEHL